jgi:hypothetical protein
MQKTAFSQDSLHRFCNFRQNIPETGHLTLPGSLASQDSVPPGHI